MEKGLDTQKRVLGFLYKSFLEKEEHAETSLFLLDEMFVPVFI